MLFDWQSQMRKLFSQSPEFTSQFLALVNEKREADADVTTDVTAIIADVRKRGDIAVRELTLKFDKFDLDERGWEVSRADCRAALDGLPSDLRSALELAKARISDYHVVQRPSDSDSTDSVGVRLGARWNAVDRAGVYVPGGRAAYPSSVLMNAIPAKVAGVGEIIMVTPTPNGFANPLVLAAAEIAGVDRIIRIGGAHAVAALAFGTDHVPAVDVITGPGNAWVAEAKRQLYGVVGIDMVAGPSEILVVADKANDPDWIAADLLSQAEHDPTSQSILITDDEAFADTVIAAVEQKLRRLATETTARASWETNGAVIIVASLDEAPALVDALAPEHLELAVDDPEPLFARVRHAGSIFLGRNTPEAIGDYVGGPNHVLPTGRRARFSSGLSVSNFMKRTSFLSCSPAALAAIGPSAIALAHAEGLPAHAESIAERLK